MARVRTIKPKFWDDIKIGRISRDARLLYIGLWNFADDVGVVIGDTVWLKSKIFPYDQIQVQQFDKWINELVKTGFICLLSYHDERFIYLPTFTRHQVINKPNHEDLNIPKKLIDSIHDEVNRLITEQSRNDTGTIREQSVLIIGREREEEVIPPVVPHGDDAKDEDDEALDGGERIDYEALMRTFNNMFAGKLARVSVMTDKRKKAVRARAAEHGKGAIMKVFEMVRQSSFLTGANEKDWVCDFDWIFRPTNFIKILEGNYARINQNGRDSGQRRINSAVAIATRVQDAAAKRRAELQAEGVIDTI